MASVYLGLSNNVRREDIDNLLADNISQFLIGDLNFKSVGWNSRRTNIRCRRLDGIDYGATVM